MEEENRLSACCGFETIPPDWEMADSMGSMWRAYSNYICKKCSEVCEVLAEGEVWKPIEVTRIKAIYVKNLKMPPEKMASQIAHAVKNLGVTPTDSNIIVLGVSTKKFGELIEEHDCYVQVDKGLTIVEAGTKTAAAWIE